MATKIKLEVNHAKHAKQESGQKLTLPTEDKKNQPQQEQTNAPVKPNINK